MAKQPCEVVGCTELSTQIYHPNGMIVCDQHHTDLTKMDAESLATPTDAERAARRRLAIFAQGMLGRN